MSSLVAADDQRRVRITPKVFADVPSRAELEAVRKNRNGLAVFVVLLLGMLAAAVAGLAWSFTRTDQNVVLSADQLVQLERLQEERARVTALLGLASAPAEGQLDTAIQPLLREREDAAEALGLETTPAIGQLDDAARRAAAEIERLAAFEDYQQYKVIHDARIKAALLRAEIMDLLADPLRAEVPETLDLDMYNGGFGLAWNQVVGTTENAGAAWKQNLEDAFRAYASALEAERNAILAWRPRPAGGAWTPPARPVLE